MKANLANSAQRIRQWDVRNKKRSKSQSRTRSRCGGRPRYQERLLRNEELQNRAADLEGDVDIGGHHWIVEADRHDEGYLEWAIEALNEFCHCVSDHTPHNWILPSPSGSVRWLSLWRVTYN